MQSIMIRTIFMGTLFFNSVRCTTGYKYDYKNGDWENIIQPLTNRICREHGLSVLDLEEAKENANKKDRKKNLFLNGTGGSEEMWTRHYRTQVLMRNFLKIFPAWDMSCGEKAPFCSGTRSRNGKAA